jgi:uncharacterized membrane protein
VLWKIPPLKRNAVYGFRTKLAFRSDSTWKYANSRFAKLLVRVGALNLIFNLILYPLLNYGFDLHYSIDFWAILFFVVSAISFIITALVVQHELKTRFGDKGSIVDKNDRRN